MNTLKPLRELIISEIKTYYYEDSDFCRILKGKPSFQQIVDLYKKYLETLSDRELLDKYREIIISLERYN